MTPTTLAETILRDVPIRGRINTGGNCLDELVFKKDVEAALTAAMDPSHDNETSAIAERAGEVLPRLRKADEYEPLGHDGWEAADLITALLAQNAALRAERDEPHWDDHCVNQFAKMMREKMALSRAKGRSGWNDPNQCSVEYLRDLLYEHLDKGDPVDVANFCMMLRHYDASTRRDYGNTLDMWKARAEAAEAEVEKLRAERDELSSKLEVERFVTDAMHRLAKAAEAQIAALTARVEAADTFAALVADARVEAEKAMRKFPQPNYVISKIAEEAGEVVKAAIHAAEGRETVENLRGEMKQLIAMLYRLWIEGDGVHGLASVDAAITEVSQ